MTEPKKEPSKLDVIWGCSSGIFLLIVCVGLLRACMSQDDVPNQKPVEKPAKVFEVDEIEAKMSCEEVVKQNLKSPSTAKFPSKKDWTFTPIAGGYKASSYVDSQNSFGATVRSDFGCTVTKAGEDKVNRSLDYLNTRQ